MRRRIFAGLIAMTIVIVVGGVAEAAITHRQGGPFGLLISASGSGRSQKDATGPEKKDVAKPTAGSQPTQGAGEPLTIGAVEAVTRLLDFGANKKTVLRYPGAEYVKPHFRRLLLLPGDYVKVSDPQGKESRLYSGEGLPVDSSVLLDLTKVLSLDSTSLMSKDQSVVPEKVAVPVAGVNKSACPVEYAHSKPVARLLINGVELCSGWRVGPNNRMLTNQHCIGASADPANTEVWFNYQCQFCAPFSPVEPVTKVLGGKLLATDTMLDFTLFSVQNFETVKRFGCLELDDRKVERGEEIYIPQHPGARKNRSR